MSRWHKLVLGLSSSLVLLIAVELVLRLFNVGALAAAADPFLDFFNDVPLFVRGRDAEGQAIYTLNRMRASKFFPASFPAHKSPGTFRVFCLGGSASQGWPHDQRFSYPSYLQTLLEAAAPGRRFEVVNLGGHTYATYRILNVLTEVLDYEPDLVIMFEANNEFLEKRYYHDPLSAAAGLQRLNAVFNHLRLYGVLKSCVNRLASDQGRSGLARQNPLDGEAGREHRRKFALKETLDLRSDPDQFERLRRHYEFNIGEMARRTSDVQVPFLILTVPVNLVDWPPNHSRHGPEFAAAGSDEFDAAVENGRQALADAYLETALSLLDHAVTLDPLHAEARFLRGRTLLALGECARARGDLVAAVDLDQLPFRALSCFNEAIRALGKNGAAHVLDLEVLFAAQSTCGCPSRELFVDYVHPNMTGNQIIARAVAREILGLGLLGAGAAADLDQVPLATDPSYYETDEHFLRSISFLHLEFGRYEDALADFTRLVQARLANESDRAIFRMSRDLILGYLQRESYAPGPRAGIEAEFHDYLEAVVFGTDEFRKRYFADRLEREAHARQTQ